MCAIGPPNDVESEPQEDPEHVAHRPRLRSAPGRAGPSGRGTPGARRERKRMDESLTVYANGRFCRYDEAKIGLLTHALHYGTGCFEGVRGFWSAREEELYLFQLPEHYERLHASAKILMMKVPLDVPALIDVTTELCARNTSTATSTFGR